MTSTRCTWAEGSDALRSYHDTEWGVPAHDDAYLFELLILESAQAGLSWSTILHKREGYRRALDGFDPGAVAGYDEAKQQALLADAGIVRHRQKVASHVANARAFLAVQDEHGSFDAYLWAWVDGTPVVTLRRPDEHLPARTELSDRLAKDLKRRGFGFLGSTTLYAYLQAVGVVDDHVVGCVARSSAG